MAIASSLPPRSLTPVEPCRHFGGDCLRTAHYPSARLAEVTYADPRRCARHSHEHSFFSLLLQGAYVERFAGGHVAHRPFATVFHADDTLHRDEIESRNTKFFLIEMDATFVREPALEARHETRPETCSAETSWLAHRLYRRFRDGTLDSLLLEGTLLEMLSPHSNAIATADRPRWLGRVVDILHAEFRQAISLNALAARIGIHPAYLSRRFRSVYRVSIGDYVNRLRVRYARRCLAEPGLALADIAQQCGFADQSHFTRMFQAHLGMTPGRFRKRSYSAFK